jgi:hypothetical protein
MVGTLAKTNSPGTPTKGAQQPVPVVPFVRGAFPHVEPFYDNTITLSANQQTVGPVDIASYGYARALLVDMQVATTGNTATVALAEDAPWSTIAEVVIQDVNGAPIYGPIAGYSAYLTHKYGGYRGQQDPKLIPNYVAYTTGAGATAPSGRFFLRLPLEINGRDGMGSLANMNASQAYKIRFTINNLATIFSTPPNGGSTTLRIRLSLEAWSQPDPTDPMGQAQATVPPANQTTQFWSRFLPNVNAGQNVVKHTRVGNYLRNIVYINRRAGTSRANGETDLANLTLQWYLDSRLLANREIEFIRWAMMEQFQFISTAAEAAGGFDNGVFVLPDTIADFDGVAGYEMRNQYLPTTQATRLELVYTLANAGVLEIITNDVAPRGNIFLP